MLVVTKVHSADPKGSMTISQRIHGYISLVAVLKFTDFLVKGIMLCCILRLRMEERPPIWRIAANKLNKQSRTADKGWSSSLGVGRDANNSSP